MIYRPELKKRVIEILQSHKGKDNAISANNLFIEATDETLWPMKAANQTRVIRQLVRDIRKDKLLPVISGNEGYWVAESDEELEAFTVKLLKTAARQFGLARELSNVPVSRMVAQYKLNFTDEDEVNEQN